MIIEASDGMMLISASLFQTMEFIDSGLTAVIKFTGADGKHLAVIMPLRAAQQMIHSFDKADHAFGPRGEPAEG